MIVENRVVEIDAVIDLAKRVEAERRVAVGAVVLRRLAEGADIVNFGDPEVAEAIRDVLSAQALVVLAEAEKTRA